MLTRKKYLYLDNINKLDADTIRGTITTQLIDLDQEVRAELEKDEKFDHNTLAKKVANELLSALHMLDEDKEEVILDILASASVDQPLFANTDAIPLLETQINIRMQNKLQRKFKQSPTSDVDAANELVEETKKFSHTVALLTLTKSLQHPLFNSDEAKSVLLHGINTETFTRSPISHNHTLKFLLQYQEKNPIETETFLGDPNRILLWLDQANPIQAARFIHHFFGDGNNRYTHIQEMQDDASLPLEQRKAAQLLIVLLSPEPLAEDRRLPVSQLLQQSQQFAHRQFQSIHKSISVLIFNDAEEIKKASGCYLNLNGCQHNGIDLSELDMFGATMHGAQMAYATLRQANLFQAYMEEANLSGADLSFTNMNNTCLRNADLSVCNLSGARLLDADLSGANLALANLRGTDLRDAKLENTNLQDANFFIPEDFADETALQAELDRLHKMLTGHKYCQILRDAITASFLSHTKSTVCTNEHALKALELAHNHPLFSTHYEYKAGKVAANALYGAGVAVVNQFSIWLSKTPQKIAPRDAVAVETDAQIMLREEIERYHRPVANRLFAQADRPPPPGKAPELPRPGTDQSMRNSK